MAAFGANKSLFLKILSILCQISSIFGAYSIQYQTVSDCLSGPTDNFHQAFDISNMQCRNCAQNSTIQTVSTDGLNCVCQSGYRLTQDFGGFSITCAQCPAGTVASTDGWSCVACGSNNPYNPATKSCQVCEENTIAVERKIDGAWPNPQLPSRKCDTCAAFTFPDAEGEQCVRCNQILTIFPGNQGCSCPADQETGGLCFESPTDIDFQGLNLYSVTFGDTTVESAYFFDNLRAAGGMCLLLGNLCALILYPRDNEDSTTNLDACAMYLQIGQLQSGAPDVDWPPNMPWLYYLDETADKILEDEAISTVFTFPDTQMNIKAAVYSLNGTFLGYEPVTNGLIQLCPDQVNILNAAWTFGTTYSQSCKVPVVQLFDTELYPLQFYDLYLEYGDNGDELFAIPLLITNYVQNGNKVNQRSNKEDWQLVRRLFLVDNVSGKPASATGDPGTTPTDVVQAIRYASAMTLHINMQSPTNGQIYPPYLEVTYSTASYEDFQDNKLVEVSFDVVYEMPQQKQFNDVAIAVGVLSALAIVYSGFQAWGWNRRAGKLGIDFVTVTKFLLFSCNNLANVFFVVAFGFGIWQLIFFKRQSTVTLIPPDSSQDNPFVAYLISAFVLKLLALAHMMYIQCSVDIFFIDWERPRGKITTSNDAQQQGREAPVSIWRTYFVANEWNEIQSCRKINQIFQIFAVILFLDVIDFGGWAAQEPTSTLNPGSDQYVSPDNTIFRFATGAVVYLVIALIQWLFYVLIYERFAEDKLRNYVDLCSMSNVSVFILENDQFGYYIHGRSVHGRSDTGLREMAEDLKREEDNLCGTRGLVPNTEQQTFQILVQAGLRVQYDKVLKPIITPAQGAAGAVRGQSQGGKQSNLTEIQEKSISAYGMLNKFLQNFIDHSLRNIDYIIKDKVLFENILNAEFQDPAESSVFYNDGGKSFGAILFMGNETTLTIFEILFFSVMDLATTNFTLSAILVYILMELLTLLRDSLGKYNLAKKTLVDERFLI